MRKPLQQRVGTLGRRARKSAFRLPSNSAVPIPSNPAISAQARVLASLTRLASFSAPAFIAAGALSAGTQSAPRGFPDPVKPHHTPPRLPAPFLDLPRHVQAHRSQRRRRRSRTGHLGATTACSSLLAVTQAPTKIPTLPSTLVAFAHCGERPHPGRRAGHRGATTAPSPSSRPPSPRRGPSSPLRTLALPSSTRVRPLR
ncbi:hypothetical protein SCP_0806430 [Sparassis crispa]|uniref:Uncharacterized protein n=1 Tax=Sparassis crispa TaxID=139825 RepID=A0A401GVA5_9APHY|nr:hypothetical protein SCP_0806430 [Sparassis crispa]GBE86119.1 hypothetical protein SCP_0806430 [Sparassis crispa]